MRFDVLLRIRPDTAFMTTVPSFCAFSPEYIYGTLRNVDHFLVVPRNLSDAVFANVHWYREKCNRTITEQNPEELLESRVREVTSDNLWPYPFEQVVIRFVRF